MTFELDREFEHVKYSPVCLRCANLPPLQEAPDTEGEHGPACRAFPGGIPWAIWDGLDNHTTPHEGDHGILFVPHGRGVVSERT